MSKARDLADFQGSASALTTGTLPVDRVPYVGRRNLIMNGDFRIWQRGDQDRITDVTDLATYPIYQVVPDRFRLGNISIGNSTVGRSTSSKEVVDGANWARVDINTGYNGTTAIFRTLVTMVEYRDGLMLPNSTVTLSFNFRAKTNGQYSVAFGYPHDDTFTIYSWDYVGAGSSQKVEITTTIPSDFLTQESGGDTGETADKSIELYFCYGSGSEAATISDDTNLNGVYNVPGTATLTRASDYKFWEISGEWVAFNNVQLELGSVATPFEHRSYGEELALCQRYFETMGHWSGQSSYADIWSMPLNNFTNCWAPHQYKVRKRVRPTITLVDGSWSNATPTYNPTIDAVLFQSNNFFYISDIYNGEHAIEVDAEL
jgi:hypothetical protein